jgi:hypothetical protein
MEMISKNWRDLIRPKGITVEEALRRYGKDPADIPLAAYDPREVAGYLEIHIEQGPALAVLCSTQRMKLPS